MDKKILLGLVIGFAGILIGYMIDDGHVGAIIQGSAAIIVFGGTIGAVLVGATDQDMNAARDLFRKLSTKSYEKMPERIYQEIYECSILARKESILQIEKRLDHFSHPFMSSVMRFVIDGVDPKVIKQVFEEDIRNEEEKMMSGAKLFLDAGGFAPTIGIIGAVLGLIHVMSNLTDTSKLGAGIAVAFVATLYGVGSANLIFIPLANKFKRIIQRESKTKEMILTGCLSIVQGYNPYIIEERMRSYVNNKNVRPRQPMANA